jgi:hypothetical protein
MSLNNDGRARRMELIIGFGALAFAVFMPMLPLFLLVEEGMIGLLPSIVTISLCFPLGAIGYRMIVNKRYADGSFISATSVKVLCILGGIFGVLLLISMLVLGQLLWSISAVVILQVIYQQWKKAIIRAEQQAGK